MNAVLGELPQTQGTRLVRGKVAFVPQQAWIINATVRENILFGVPFDEDKYNATLDACALRPGALTVLGPLRF